MAAENGSKWEKVADVTGFLGQYQTTMDNKGRFALPARLRAVAGPDGVPLLSGEVVLTKGLEGCLALFPQTEWEEIQRRLADLNFTQKKFRLFGRLFYSAAIVVEPDRSGRILAPSHLIADAGLRRDLLVIGVNRWIEIWNPERFAYYLQLEGRSYEDVAEQLFSGDAPERT